MKYSNCTFKVILKREFLWQTVGGSQQQLRKPEANPCTSNSGLYLEDSVDPVFLKCRKHVYVVIFSLLQTLVNFQVGKADTVACGLLLQMPAFYE